MAISVNQAFDEFNTNIVNLTKQQTDSARSSRDWLLDQLLNFPKSIIGFPQDYPERHIRYGSFARNTKIRPIDDIDLMYCFGGGNAYYKIDLYDPSIYYIQTENATQNLKNLSVNNVLNSIKVVNKLVSSLGTIPQYKKADINRNQEAAVLDLTSYTWSYDIVPCFYTDTNFYLIPDGKGNWKATNPSIDQENIKYTNQNFGGKVYQLVRTLKYWNFNFSSPKIGSYLFEVLILNYVKSQGAQNQYNDINIKDFFNYLSNNILNDVQDPKNIQGNINNLERDQKVRIYNKAKNCYDIAVTALDFEVNQKNQKKAIENWQKIFGNNFPTYE